VKDFIASLLGESTQIIPTLLENILDKYLELVNDTCSDCPEPGEPSVYLLMSHGADPMFVVGDSRDD